MRVRLAPDARLLDEGRVVVGGSPLVVLRCTDAGATALRRWAAPDGGTPGNAAERRLAARLVERGVLDPVPADAAHDGDGVTVVVPAHDRAAQLGVALAALRATAPRARLVVVDDGSADRAGVATAARAHGATTVRREVAGGPAAARNAGLAAVDTPLVAFVDSDVEVRPGWLAPLVELLEEGVAMAAPRVRSVGTGLRGAYEAARSPLDLGARPGAVRAGSRVAYVPAAALVARAEVLRGLGGFDEALPVGEDVDLCWRLTAAGDAVRFAGDAAVVRHREPDERHGWWPWWRRRVAYGTSAAPLDARHPTAVAPLGVSGWSVGVWALVALGHPVGALAVAGATSVAMVRRLEAVPPSVAVGLVLRGHLGAGELIARALWRPWFPFALAAASVSRRARLVAAVSAVVPATLDHRRRRPAVGLARWVALCALDDLGYATGVWLGAARLRSFRSLRPAIRSWPGSGAPRGIGGPNG